MLWRIRKIIDFLLLSKNPRELKGEKVKILGAAKNKSREQKIEFEALSVSLWQGGQLSARGKDEMAIPHYRQERNLSMDQETWWIERQVSDCMHGKHRQLLEHTL